jgi:hypothetical protein
MPASMARRRSTWPALMTMPKASACASCSKPNSICAVSDATLDWLVRNEVVTPNERGDAAALLRGINDWLDRTQP